MIELHIDEDGQADHELPADPNIGVTISGVKGYLGRLEFEGDRWTMFCVKGGPSQGNGWHFNQDLRSLLRTIREYHTRRAFLFTDSKMLFRWLGSDQPI